MARPRLRLAALVGAISAAAAGPAVAGDSDSGIVLCGGGGVSIDFGGGDEDEAAAPCHGPWTRPEKRKGRTLSFC